MTKKAMIWTKLRPISIHCRLRLVGRMALLVVLIVFSFAVSAGGQQVVVRVLNGRSGKPMSKIRVYIGFGDLKGRQPLDLTTDKQGELHFNADEESTIQVHPVGTVACGRPIWQPFFIAIIRSRTSAQRVS